MSNAETEEWREIAKKAKQEMDGHVSPLERLYETVGTDDLKTRLAEHDAEPFGVYYDELLAAVIATVDAETLKEKCAEYVRREAEDILRASEDVVGEMVAECKTRCEAAAKRRKAVVADAKDLLYKAERALHDARSLGVNQFDEAMRRFVECVELCKRCGDKVGDAVRVAQANKTRVRTGLLGALGGAVVTAIGIGLVRWLFG